MISVNCNKIDEKVNIKHSLSSASTHAEHLINLTQEGNDIFLSTKNYFYFFKPPFHSGLGRCRLQNAATHPGLECTESARDFKFNQAARWSNNKENDQKMADNAYLFRVYVLYTFVS